jgi:hypothetical protein
MRRFFILMCALKLLLFPWLVLGPVLSGLFPVCPVLHVQAGRNDSETKQNNKELCSSLTNKQTNKQTA